MLKSKFEEHIGVSGNNGGIEARGWFLVNRRMVTSAFCTMFIALVVAASSKMIP